MRRSSSSRIRTKEQGRSTKVLARREGPFEHWLEFVDEVADVFETPIDAGEADVGNLVDDGQTLHDERADFGAFDFRLAVGVHVAFDVGDYALDLLVANRPL